jgi:predicted secreted hydrolase
MGRLVRAIALLILPGFIASSAELPGTISPSNDAYHLKYWPDTAGLAAYTEWWYFNLVDPGQNVQAVLVYFITNPDEVGTAPSAGNMVAIAFTPSAVTTEVDVYPASAFSAAYNVADVQLGSNAIQVTSDNTYNLTGASQDGAIAWDLTFDREAQSFQGLNLAELGEQPWEMMSWLVYMPRAGVTGQLTINGTTYTVSGSGYHDHNWGEWIQHQVQWNWAQYSQNDLWFDIYDFIGQNNGTAHVGVNGTIFEFTKSQYQLVHTKYAYDSVNHVDYPIQTTFKADNGTEQLEMVMNVSQTAPLTDGFPYPVPEYIIYEQAATYLGQVVANGTTLKFSGAGFKEYTVERQ